MNKFRNSSEEIEQEEIPETPVIQEPVQEKEVIKKKSAFSEWMNSMMSKESAVGVLPFIFFLAVLGMFYIANKHYAEKNIRQIDKINKELKELKWEYTTAKSELMFRSKQTEVAKVTELFGLKEAMTPPVKILVKQK